MQVSQNRTLLGIIAIVLVLLAAVVYFYNQTLNDLAAGSCSTELDCPHEQLVKTQNVIIAIMLVVIAAVVGWIGYQLFFRKEEGTPPRQIDDHVHSATRKIDLAGLEPEEKKVISLIQEKGGSAFQSDVIGATGFTKVKVSRILDRLEQKGHVERKRRGMANLVVLK